MENNELVWRLVSKLITMARCGNSLCDVL